MTEIPGFPALIAQRVDNAHTRIDGVEGRVSQLELSEAVAAERAKNMQNSLSQIEANTSRVVWLVVTGLVGALVAFVIKGGLNVQ
ncbi:hemolysin XhlA family protein [Rhizobium sp. SL86]|uniref:hemolysin XhlA family protein n=1 Tax=Rhizobium sp. SL86 TaxID=2995148 RepID=UPI002275598D|nr:hemolysin XhlA family protein [Rhizobium sp. SL86]MCY1668065.1 hemolysin XhlA family protein [Rhizobium sp. SL86]